MFSENDAFQSVLSHWTHRNCIHQYFGCHSSDKLTTHMNTSILEVMGRMTEHMVFALEPKTAYVESQSNGSIKFVLPVILKFCG